MKVKTPSRERYTINKTLFKDNPNKIPYVLLKGEWVLKTQRVIEELKQRKYNSTLKD